MASTATVLIPWLGPFPAWMPCFLASCATSTRVRWIIFHDAPAPPESPKNVRFVAMPAEAFRERVQTRLGINPPPELGYKLCDFRPAYGVLFREFIDDCEYYGWGDLDLVYGDLDRFLEPLLGAWDVLSFHRVLLSGHFTLLRNDAEHRSLHTRIREFNQKLLLPAHCAVDDIELSELVRSNPKAHFVEHFTTPFVNWIPWADGTYNFPKRWRWNQGRLTNDLDVGYEFIYFHFMVWKGGKREYYVDTKSWQGRPAAALGKNFAGDAFVLDENGISAAPGRQSRPLRLMSEETSPQRTIIRRLRIKWQGWANKL